MHDVRRTAAENRVIAVEALGGVAGVATFFEADDVGIAKVPASRALQEIAADRCEITNLRRGGFTRRLRQRGEMRADKRIRRHLMHLHQGAHLETAFAVGFDGVDTFECFEIDQTFGTDYALLQQIEQIDAAGKRGMIGLGEQPGDLVQIRRCDYLEAIHQVFSSALSTLSGVIGNARTGTPIAS